MKYTIIIPAYNEAPSLSSLLPEIVSLALDAEIIVVDDCSSDNTKELVEFYKTIKYIKHVTKRGNGASVKTGISVAKGQFVILLDADGQHQPSDILRLIEYSDYSQMVVGARKRPESSTNIHRDIPNIFYNKWVSYLVGDRVLDVTSGFRIIDSAIAKGLINLLPNGYSYPTTITLAMFGLGYSVYYVSIITRSRKQGKSQMRYWRDGIIGISSKILTFSLVFFPRRLFLPGIVLFATLTLLSSIQDLLAKTTFSLSTIAFLLFTVLVFLVNLITSRNSFMFKYELKNSIESLRNTLTR